MGRSLEEITGDVLRKYRSAQNLSQESLAEATGVDRSYISLVENGKYRVTLITLFEIAHALDVNPSQIVAEIEEQWVRPPKRGRRNQTAILPPE